MDILLVPFTTATVGIVGLVFWFERLFFGARAPKLQARHQRALSIASENWARGLFPAASQAPTSAIQSIMWFQKDQTPTEQELAEAFYQGTVKDHSRMRSHLVEITQKLPEWPFWKLLKLLRLVGDKEVSRMAFVEHEDYLLPQDVDYSHRHDKDGGAETVVPATPGPRGPDLLRARHIRSLDVDSEEEIWNDITRVMEVSFMDTTKALWEIWIYRNKNPNAKQRNAVVFRISHIIGDGISLMKLATGFFQSAGTKEHLKFTPPPRWQPKFNSWFERIQFWLWDTWMTLKANVHVTSFLLLEDTHTEFKVGWYPERFVPANKRHVEVFEPLAIEDINKVRETAQVQMGLAKKPTINDMLHSMFAGAVAAYLQEKGDKAFLAAEKRGGARIRCFSPFMFPHPSFDRDPTNDLHNLWSMSSSPLPVSAPTPLKRLVESQKLNSWLVKTGHDARAAMQVQKLFATVFGWQVQSMINMRATTAHSFTWSNVPGFSRGKISIWNPSGKGPERVVDNSMFILTTPTPYFTSHSYDGKINVCFCADPDRVTDMKRLGELFANQFKELAEEVGVSLK